MYCFYFNLIFIYYYCYVYYTYLSSAYVDCIIIILLFLYKILITSYPSYRHITKSYLSYVQISNFHDKVYITSTSRSCYLLSLSSELIMCPLLHYQYLYKNYYPDNTSSLDKNDNKLLKLYIKND